MENQINIKEKTSEELGIMLAEMTAQFHQNYYAIANELRSRMPQVTTTNLQPKDN